MEEERRLKREREELEERRAMWEDSARFAAYFTWGGSLVLLAFILGSAAMTGADHRAKAREAAAQGKSLDAHYAHLLVHGILHLSGHDHEADADAVRMDAVPALGAHTESILRELGLGDSEVRALREAQAI